MNWDQLTDDEKIKATHYLDGMEVFLGHEPDTDELRRHWDNLTEDEQAEILEEPDERQFDVGAQNDTRFGGTLDETGE